MRKYLSIILLALGLLYLGGCGGETEVDVENNPAAGKSFRASTYFLVLDLMEDSSLTRSPTSLEKGSGISLETLVSCAGCLYYKSGNLRNILSPGDQVTVTKVYRSSPGPLSMNATPTMYYLVQNAQGQVFTMPEYEFSRVMDGKSSQFDPRVASYERLLNEFRTSEEKKTFLLTVSPSWLEVIQPGLRPPYSRQVILDYFDPLLRGLSLADPRDLISYSEVFSLKVRVNKRDLANILLHSEGLNFTVVRLIEGGSSPR